MFNWLSSVFDFLSSISIPMVGTDIKISVAQILVGVVVNYLVFLIIAAFFKR